MGSVLVVDDEHLIRWSLQQHFSKVGHEVLTAETGAEALRLAEETLPDAVFLDILLPDGNGIDVLRSLKELDPEMVVIMITAHGAVDSAVAAMKLGAYDYVEKPFDLGKLKVMLDNALERATLRREVAQHRREQNRRYGLHRVVGESQAMRGVLEMVRKVARSDAATVLLQGESGVGKDLLARVIHYQSTRRDFPFMEINCSALPETLVESELLGHERWAYTDAKTMKKGLFELADGGTVFLDEIGDMPLGIQAKLLKVIEEKRFKRIGGTKDIQVDVRIIAATNQDLEGAVREGRFRQDLYYRLQVIPIRIPPLRERREDIPPLVEHFLQEFAREFKKPAKKVSEPAMALLQSYAWPGNVRELRNVLERVMILESAQLIQPEHLLLNAQHPHAFPAEAEEPPVRLPPGGVCLEEVEKSLIRQALQVTGGNQVQAAKLLNLTRDVLRYRMKKYGYL